jgi:hypothetical protein
MPKDTTSLRSRTPKFFELRNFDSLQHRVTDSRTGEQKSLPWIKLYHSLLDDADFEQLPDEAKFHYIGLLLLARKIGNKLPYNAEYLARKIAANSRINLELLLQRKFIVPCKRNKTQGEEYAPSMHRKRTEDALDRDKTEREKETTTDTDETARAALPIISGEVVVGDNVLNFAQDRAHKEEPINRSEFTVDLHRQYLEEHRATIMNPRGFLKSCERGEQDRDVRFWLDEKSASNQRAAANDERASERSTNRLSEGELKIMAENFGNMLASGYLLEHLRAKYRAAMTGDEWRRVVEMLEAGTQQMAEGARVAV